MRQAFVFSALLLIVFLIIDQTLGFPLAMSIGFAATLAIAACNSITFLWLWYVRATPLALGMALNWIGQAAITLWWFTGGLHQRLDWLPQSEAIFSCLAIYLVGGAFHVTVIQRSIETRATRLVWPLIIGFAVIVGSSNVP